MQSTMFVEELFDRKIWMMRELTNTRLVIVNLPALLTLPNNNKADSYNNSLHQVYILFKMLDMVGQTQSRYENGLQNMISNL